MGVARRQARKQRESADTVEQFAGMLPSGPAVLSLSCIDLDSDGCGGRPATLARAFAGLGYQSWYHPVRTKDGTRMEGSGVVVIDRAGLEALEPLIEATRGVVICHVLQQVEVAARMQDAGWFLVYDMMDDWAEFAKSGDLPRGVVEREPELCRRADLVTCSAPRLAERAEELGAERTAIVHNGGPEWPVERPIWSEHVGTRVGFSGALWGSWIDWECMDALECDGDITGWIVGRYEGVANQSYSRLQLTGMVPYAGAMRMMSQCDCGIIPFRGPLCPTVDPVKAYDYWACGMWSVATPELEPMHGRPYTILADRFEFPDACREAAEKRISDPPSLEWVRANSWTARAREMWEAIVSVT